MPRLRRKEKKYKRMEDYMGEVYPSYSRDGNSICKFTKEELADMWFGDWMIEKFFSSSNRSVEELESYPFPTTPPEVIENSLLWFDWFDNGKAGKEPDILTNVEIRKYKAVKVGSKNPTQCKYKTFPYKLAEKYIRSRYVDFKLAKKTVFNNYPIGLQSSWDVNKHYFAM